MLTITPPADERLTPARRARFAYIYVRQSSVGKVKHHQESTELQYRLVDRAVGLGWPRQRVCVIDDDLGKSGGGQAERHGFQRLIAEIGLGNAGLVISFDASRLARNNRDWHQLPELCSIFGVIIADGERLYDPGAYYDRLLLGLSGIYERSGAAPDSDAAPSGRAAEGRSWRASHAAPPGAHQDDLADWRRQRAQDRSPGAKLQ